MAKNPIEPAGGATAPRAGGRWGQITAAIFFLLILVSRLPSINQPFGRDQGIFACVGQNMLKGFVPYRDLWDQKPPGIHFTYALFVRLFGDSMRLVQVMDLLAFVVTAYLVYRVVREIAGARAGALAVPIYFFYSNPLFYAYTSGYWARSQAETYMAPLLVAGLWFFVRSLRSPPGRLTWLAGLFWGGAFLYKYTTALYPLGALAFLALFPVPAGGPAYRGARRYLLRAAALLGLGFAAALLPAVVYFAANGALKDLVELTVVYNWKYAGAVRSGAEGMGFTLGQAAKWIGRNPFLWLTGLAGGVTVAFRAKERRKAAIWLFWLAAAWGAIAMNRRYFHYHFIQMAAPLAMLSAYGLSMGIESMRNRWLRLVMLPILAACVLLLALDVEKVRQSLKLDLDLALGKTTRPRYLASFATGDFSFLADFYLADYLKERTGPQDRVFIFGFEPVVYFLSDRRPASRYIFNDPVTAPYVDPEEAAAGIERIVADLESSRPEYIVVVEGDGNPVDPTSSFRFFENTPPIRDFVESGYIFDRQARKFHIFKRRGQT